jgi:fructose-1,6-bisphosphatase/inositol monophosphatase family enzyme
MLAALTIWRDDFVSDFIVATTSIDLEACLPAGHNRFLAGDYDHRHGTKVRVGGSSKYRLANVSSGRMDLPRKGGLA